MCCIEKIGQEFHGVMPFSRRQQALFHGKRREADISLFWMRTGRQCFQFSDAIQQLELSRVCAVSGTEEWDCHTYSEDVPLSKERVRGKGAVVQN
jgi:hypothetical protein